jgi:hypothetical protein
MIRAALLAAVVAMLFAPAADAAGKRCRRGEIAVHGIVRGDRIDLRAGRGPVIACMRPPRAATDARAEYRAAMSMMRDQRLYAPALRRFVRRLRHPRAADAAFDKALLRGLAPAARAARVRKDLGSGTIEVDGIRMTGKGWEILPDPDELPIPERRGYDVEGDYQEGGVTGHKHKLFYVGSFAKRCPDANGASAGDYEKHAFEEVGRDVEGARNLRVFLSTDLLTTARFEGHVGDDARLKDFDIEIRFAFEIKGRLEIASTGKQIGRSPTQVYRGFVSVKGLKPDGTGIAEAVRTGRGRFDARGPKGSDGLAALASLLIVAQSEAIDAAANRLHEAEQWWYGDEAAHLPESRQPGNCVELALDPESLELGEGETRPVDVRLRAKDGAEVAATHRVTPDEWTHGKVTPDSATGTPGTPARFDYTAPSPRPFDDDDPFTALKLETTSKRGRARGSIDARIPRVRTFRVTFEALGHKTRDEPAYTLSTTDGPLTWRLHQTSAFSWRVVFASVTFGPGGRAYAFSREHSASGSYQSTGETGSQAFSCGDFIGELDPAQSPELAGARGPDGSWRLAIAALAKRAFLWSDNAGCSDPLWAMPGAWTMWDEGPHDASTTAFVTVTPEQLASDRFSVHVEPAPGTDHPERCHRVMLYDPADSNGPFDCTYDFGWSGAVTFERIH